MDRSVNPWYVQFLYIISYKLIINFNHSDNFDQFVCGKWKEESEIPSDSGSYTQFSVVRKDLSATLRRVLENEDTEKIRKRHN